LTLLNLRKLRFVNATVQTVDDPSRKPVSDAVAAIIGFVQKYVRKQIPPPRFRPTAFLEAIELGAARIGAGLNVRDYIPPSPVCTIGAMLTLRI
jgi:hypothetical protein